MKTKFILLAIVVVALYVKNGYAQIVPTVKKIEMSERNESVFAQHLNRYTVFAIDKKELVNNLQSDGNAQFRLKIDEKMDWIIDLEVNDMRAPNFRQVFTTKNGEVEHTEFVLNTFRGFTSRGQVVRFTIDENNFFGVILNGEDHYVIRPVSEYTQNRNDKNFIVYRSSDIIVDFGDFDYIHNALIVPENYGIRKDGQSTTNTTASVLCSYRLLIATDADYEFFQRHGNNTNNRILSILNIVEGVYESTFGLRFSVVYQNVFDWPNTFYDSFDASELLSQFRGHWNRNKTHVYRHIAHLFTGKTLNHNTVGLVVERGQINNDRAYSLSMEHQWLSAIVAHEIGHHLNARHAPTVIGFRAPCECFRSNPSIMCGDLRNKTSSALWFCEFSIYEISNFINYNRDILLTPGTPQNCTDRIVIGGWINPVCAGRGLQIYVANATNFSITVSDILGRIVHRGSGNITATSESYPVTIWSIPSSFATGNYNVQITFSSPSHSLTNTYRFLIQGCPPASISGSDIVCTEVETEYTLHNAMATRWFVTPADAFTIVDYDFDWAIVKANQANGQTGTLTAVVSGVAVNRAIQACMPTLSGPTTITFPHNCTITIRVDNLPASGVTNVDWSNTHGLTRIRTTTTPQHTATFVRTPDAHSLNATVFFSFNLNEVPSSPLSQTIRINQMPPSPSVVDVQTNQHVINLQTGRHYYFLAQHDGGFTNFLNYQWTLRPISPSAPNQYFTGQSTHSTPFSPLRVGIYALDLRVNDGCGWVPGFGMLFSVSDPLPPPPPPPPPLCPICFGLDPRCFCRPVSPCFCLTIPCICMIAWGSVHPNPVDDVLTIDLTQRETNVFEARTTSEQIFDIRLINAHGIIVRRQRTQVSTIQFDVANLPEGTYFLHIEHNGEIQKHQIIINRN